MVLENACSLLSRLDLWGEVLDLMGLTILLSNDVRWLKGLHNCLTRLPYLSLGRHQCLLGKLQKGLKKFEEQHMGNDMPMLIETLEGTDADTFSKLFAGWGRRNVVPETVYACAVYLNRDRPEVPAMIYPSDTEPLDDRKPKNIKNLATPTAAPVLFELLDKHQNSAIYTPGFALMALGSILLIIRTLLHP